jgi:hypothetical protein
MRLRFVDRPFYSANTGTISLLFALGSTKSLFVSWLLCKETDEKSGLPGRLETVENLLQAISVLVPYRVLFPFGERYITERKGRCAIPEGIEQDGS